MVHMFIKYNLTIVLTKANSTIKHTFGFELGVSQMSKWAPAHSPEREENNWSILNQRQIRKLQALSSGNRHLQISKLKKMTKG